MNTNAALGSRRASACCPGYYGEHENVGECLKWRRDEIRRLRETLAQYRSDLHTICLGPLTLRQHGPNQIEIGHENGEWGTFSAKEVLEWFAGHL